ncbi:MAG: HAD family hydrolase [Halobacteriales archaeon]
MAGERPVEAVVFDVNGVLVDSMRLHVSLTRELLAEAGVTLADDQLAAYRGLGAADFFEAVRADAGADFDAEAMAERKLDAFAAAVDDVPAMDGAAATVRSLARGYAVGVASNDGRRAVDAVLDRLGIAEVVGAVATIEDVAAGKPDPAVYELAVDRLGVQPPAAVAVDDSAVGVEAAQAAGLDVVGFNGSGDDPLAEAATTVDQLRELPAAIDRLA